MVLWDNVGASGTVGTKGIRGMYAHRALYIRSYPISNIDSMLHSYLILVDCSCGFEAGCFMR